MEESELTRKAIEELMQEMDEYKEKEIIPTERKKNPMGRPNKLFLGRTINSVMNHNKRQIDRNLQRCEYKLKELDAMKTKHEPRKHGEDRYSELEYSHEITSNNNSNDRFTPKNMKRKKKERKKKRHRSRSISSSHTSCSNETNSSWSLNLPAKSKSKKEKHKDTVKEDEDFRSNCMEYYVDPNIAYAVMAFNQMSHLMQQQQLENQTKEKEESIEIPSDLSISCHSSSDSSINISLHSSSAEEDENGILTFKLSSDDEERGLIIPPCAEKKNKDNFLKDCDDMDSIHSHISLDSKDSEKSIIKEANEIFELSSSDSDELEIVNTDLANICN